MQSQSQTKSPSNKHFWHTSETRAAPEAIWKIWTDVPNWKQWDEGLKDAKLKGEFKKDTKGFIFPKKGRKARFKIVDFEEGKSYTFKTNLPLGGLFVKRTLETKNGKTFFTHEVWFEGITKGIFAKALGKDFRAVLPEVMKKIKLIAEKTI